MERQVVFRDRQEVQAADFNNMQLFADQTFQHMVMDAITTERMFVGLLVTQKSATEINVTPGRLWDGPSGKVFRKDEAETVSLFSLLPVADLKWLCISVIGQEIETDVQPRDFQIDLQSGQTEPRAVAMESLRNVAMLVTAGLESAAPQKPEAPTGYTVIAYILLGTSGIVDIQSADNKKLMRLFDVYQIMLGNVAWINDASPKLASLQSDIASLAALVRSMQTSRLVTQIAAELALIRDKLSLPTTYTEYEADNFLSSAESDTQNPEYAALVSMGVRFPWAGETEKQLALFNPYETAIQNFSGLVLPAHTLAARLKTTGAAGTLNLAAYQYQTLTTRQCTRTRRRTTYSPTFVYCTNGAVWGNTDPATVVEEVFEGAIPAGVTLGDTQYRETLGGAGSNGVGHELYNARNVWVHTWTENYWVVDSVENNINGCINAQTFLNSQNGWLRKVGLTFASRVQDGPVNLLLCNCTSDGLPNLERVLGTAVVQPADIKTDGNETLFEFPQPIFLSPGLRYAMVLVTAGAHVVKLVEGTKYSQGTLLYSTDGDYFQGDFTKDLMMTLYYASFSNPRTVIDLEPISLAEGIAAFDILHEVIQPEATSLVLQYQPSGTGDWFSIEDGTTDRLLGLPAMCRLRAVFSGSQDIMPCLGLAGSKFRAQRPGTSFRHISTVRNLGEAAANIDVILRLEGWDAARHACTVKLLSGGNTYAASSVADEQLDETTVRRTVNFRPNSPTGITTYKIQIEGSTTTALACFHVAQRMDVAQ